MTTDVERLQTGVSFQKDPAEAKTSFSPKALVIHRLNLFH